MKTKLILLLLLLIHINCQNKNAPQKLAAIGFYSSPQQTVKTLSVKKNKSLHEHYMLGVAYKKMRKYKQAMFHFANCAFTTHRDYNLRLFAHPVYTFLNSFHFKSEYYNDAVYHISDLFYKYQEYKYLLKYFDLYSADPSALSRNMAILKARTLTRLKKYQQAKQTLLNIIDDYEDKTSKSLLLIRIGSINQKMKKIKSAVDSYSKAIQANRDSWQAAVAAKQMLRLVDKHHITLSPVQKLVMAHGLFRARRYKTCANILLSIRNRISREQLELLSRSLIRQRKLGTFKKLLNAPKTRRFRDALLAAGAKELWYMRKKYQSIQLFRQLLKSTNPEYKKYALKKIAGYYEDRRLKGYRAYLLQYKNNYKDKTAAHFLWLLGRNSLKDNNKAAAEKYFKEALLNYPAARDSDKCRFWLYKLYSRIKPTVALQYAKDLVALNSNSSYTWFMLHSLQNKYSISYLQKKYTAALHKEKHNEMIYFHTLLFIKQKNIKKRNKRLRQMDLTVINKHAEINKHINSLTLSTKYKGLLKSLKKYFQAGDKSGIYRELKIIPEDDTYKRDRNTALAYFGKKYNNFFLMAHAAEEVYDTYKIKENIALMPIKTVSMLLPRAFKRCVTTYSKRYSIDPAKIYAVIKAESLFNHTAVSSAGAVGLMQLMPRTARGIARQLKIKKYRLKNPCTSILFGTKYISWLNRYFKKNFVYIVAGYNAGAGNVNKWKKRLNLRDMDYFSEFVPFFETRYYIMRTTKFLVQYKTVYR